MLLETPKNLSGEKWSDEEVFIQSLQEPDMFAEVVDRYNRAFLRKAKEILKDEDEAYDAVQEAFVRMYASARKYRAQQNASFKAWAYKILVNQCFTLYQKNRKNSLRQVSLDDDGGEDVPDQKELDSYDQKLTKEYVLSLVSRLPTLLARTVNLYFIEGLPQKEIAERENVSPEAIRIRIHRAKKELRQIALNI
jgi:RNA polymerase sigma-70 factor (ECF subfamily)